VECQHKVDEAFMDTRAWTRMSILNVANMGKFSSDRSIQEYCDDIWKVTPVPVQLEEYCQSATTLNVAPDGAYWLRLDQTQPCLGFEPSVAYSVG